MTDKDMASPSGGLSSCGSSQQAVSPVPASIPDAKPWESEPDNLAWRSEGGLGCLIVRHPSIGHLCGYVAIEKGHPWFDKHYDAIDPYPEVHGGLTYSEVNAPNEKPDGRWWLGFDCAHSGDLCPMIDASRGWETYRTVEYVEAECERLAAQAIEARRAETGTGSVHESAVRKDAPKGGQQ